MSKVYQSEFLEKFKKLLKEIFQFDVSDLDFGVYRILNYKRKEIERFIEEDLEKKVKFVFDKYRGEYVERVESELEKLRNRIIKELGNDAITPEGDIKDKYRDTPIAKEYLDLKEKKERVDMINTIESQVFNDLYDFFSRYCEEGDFIPQYRYSIRKHSYAIPYNGEDVKLYWVSSDQYYTKTGVLFRNYTFIAGSFKVVFRVVDARDELNSNKATTQRFFVLDSQTPVEVENRSIVIRFQYRELDKKEVDRYDLGKESNTSKQEKINGKTCEIILSEIQKVKGLGEQDKIQLINHLTRSVARKTEDQPSQQGSKSSSDETLLHHLRRFTAKNTKDYFIHKNIGKFLSDQLDYFVKSKVLDIPLFEENSFLNITRARVVYDIGKEIIEFLAQIEDFQKMLWEKKKFVLETNYVITLDRIRKLCGEEYYNEVVEEVINNPTQLREWKKLGFLDRLFKQNKNGNNINTTNGNLFDEYNESDEMSEVEDENQDSNAVEQKKLDSDLTKEEEDQIKKLLKSRITLTLPIDTKHFDESFKYKLLQKITLNKDLDDLLDGVLIKSENWQALNLLLNRYKDKIQTIYIDPPFNKEQDADYLYNVKYKDSTWATMLENRLRLARELLNDRGSIFVRCDYNGNWIVRPLMDEVFGKENFRNEIILERGMQTRKAERRLLNKTDSLFFYAKDFNLNYLEIMLREKEIVKSFKDTLRVLKKIPIKDVYMQVQNFLKEYLWMPFLSMPGEQKLESYREIFGIRLYPPKGRHWAFSQESLNLAAQNGTARLVCLKCNEIITSGSQIRNGKCIKCGGDRFEGQIYSLYNQINNNWTDIPGYEQDPSFPTKNSEILLNRVIDSTSNEGDFVMDFFLGSGTTTAVAHKLKRKWIGVEMGEHFWTVVLPRMKKVLFYDSSGISKEKDVMEKYNEKTAGGFFKYHILEQYEDTLDNIELENIQEGDLFSKLPESDEYLLKYFLKFETRESPYLLNLESIKDPFQYKLRVNLSEVGEPKEIVVDIPETFNYLLGLKVKKVKVVVENGRRYLFTLGEKEGRNIVVVWRKYDDSWKEEDYKKDKELINRELQGDWKPDVVYVGCQSILTPKGYEVKYIEPEFERLMFENLLNS